MADMIGYTVCGAALGSLGGFISCAAFALVVQRRTVMAECKLCGDEYPRRRLELGYHLCLDCGDKRAHRVANHRAKCSAPSYNKGAYQPVMDVGDARWVGR